MSHGTPSSAISLRSMGGRHTVEVDLGAGAETLAQADAALLEMNAAMLRLSAAQLRMAIIRLGLVMVQAEQAHGTTIARLRVNSRGLDVWFSDTPGMPATQFSRNGEVAFAYHAKVRAPHPGNNQRAAAAAVALALPDDALLQRMAKAMERFPDGAFREDLADPLWILGEEDVAAVQQDRMNDALPTSRGPNLSPRL